MSIPSVVSRIDIIVNGQRALDDLARGYDRLNQVSTNAQASINRHATIFAAAHTNMGRAMGITNQGFRGFSSFMGDLTDRLATHGSVVNSTRGYYKTFTGEIAQLTKTMVTFSVLLPLVTLPVKAIKSFQDFTKAAVDWEHEMRFINSMVGADGAGFRRLDTDLRKLSTQYGLTIKDMDAVQKITSTLSALNRPLTIGVDAHTKALYDQADALTMTSEVAYLASAAFTDLAESQDVLFTAMAAGNFSMDRAREVGRTLYQGAVTGKQTFPEISQYATQFLTTSQPFMNAATTEAGRFKVFQELMKIETAASLSMGAAKAATGVGNMFKSLGSDVGSGAASARLIAAASGKFDGAGNFLSGLDITPKHLLEIGPMETMRTLQAAIGPNSNIINKYIDSLKNKGRVFTPESEASQREAAYTDLMAAFIPDVRGKRGFSAAMNSMLTSNNDFDSGLNNGALETAYGQSLLDPKKIIEKYNALMRNVGLSLVDNTGNPMVMVKSRIYDSIATMVDSKEYEKAGFFQKIKQLTDKIFGDLANWFNTGGKAKIKITSATVTHEFIVGMGEFLKGGEGKGSLGEIGHTIASTVADQFGQDLPGLMVNALQSGIVRTAATYYIASRGLGLSRGVAAVTALGANSAFDNDNPAAKVMGAVGLAAIFGAFGKRLTRPIPGTVLPFGPGIPNIPTNGIRMFGQNGLTFRGETYNNPGDIGRGLQGWAVTRNELTNLNPVTGNRNPYTGRFWRNPGNVFRDSAGYLVRSTVRANQLARQAASSRFGGLRRWGGLGLGAALAVPEIIESAGNEDHRWEGILGATGGVLGGWGAGIGAGALSAATGIGILGSPLAAIAAGGVGYLAGGKAGAGLGSWIDNLLRKPGQRGGDLTEEQSVMVQTFAMGMDASSVPDELQRIYAAVRRTNGTGGRANTSFEGFAGGGSLASAAGVPFNNDGNFITSQFASGLTLGTGGRQLSPKEAAALCGPAAAVYFAKLHGRQPTLQEALNLSLNKNLWQSGDNAQMKGLSAEDQLLTAMDIPHSTIARDKGLGEDDWSTIQNQAKNGVILSTPLHYFQIGGYDPDNQKYYVGDSGKVFSGGRGSDWLTRQQIQNLAGNSDGYILNNAGPVPSNNSSPSGKDAIRKMAMNLEKTTGVPWQVTMAIAGNETGYGTAGVGAERNNLFGITTGKTGSERFARYANYQESVDDFGALMSTPYYAKALARGKAGDINGMIQSLRDLGYVGPDSDQGAWVRQVQAIAAGQRGGDLQAAFPGGGLFTGNSSGNQINIASLIGNATIRSEQDIKDLAAQLADALEGVANDRSRSQEAQVRAAS